MKVLPNFYSDWRELQFWESLQNNWRLTNLFLIVLNLCITIPLAASLNIWVDEAYSLNTSSKDIGYAITQAIYFEEQSPPYFVLLTLWRNFNESIFFARLLSIICISLTIYLSALISKRFFEELNPNWLAAIVAFSPYTIAAAVEIRLYALSTLFAALLLILFFDGYLSDQHRPLARKLYVAIAIISIYTHYFLAFLLIANGFALLGLRRTRALRCYLLDMVIVGALFLPMAIIVIQQMGVLSDNPIEGERSAPLIDALKGSFSGLLRYTVPATLTESSLSFWRATRLIIFAGLIASIVKNYRSINKNHLAIWLLAIALFSLYFCVFFATDTISFRHTNIQFFPTLLVLFSALSLIKYPSRKRALPIVCSTLIVLYSISLGTQYSPLAKGGDYIRVAKYLMAHEQPNQPILVFNPEDAMTLEHYYQGINRLMALPQPEDFKVFSWRDLVLQNQQDVLAALARTPGDYRSIWLVTTEETHQNSSSSHDSTYYAPSRQVLDDFVAQYYSIENSQDFFGSNVKALSQKRSFPSLVQGE